MVEANARMRLLLVEDERELAETLARGLRSAGFACDLAYDGPEGELKASLTPYDLLVLDVNLPGLNGIDLCRRLRAEGCRAPILMLTARTDVADRILGLNSGADDYLGKPFDFEELKARLFALLRRAAVAPTPLISIGDLQIDPTTRRASWRSASLSLTAREFDLLAFLARSHPAVISAEQILEHVWDEHADPFTNTVRVHLANLRRKLREQTGESLIETLVGKGYRLCLP